MDNIFDEMELSENETITNNLNLTKLEAVTKKLFVDDTSIQENSIINIDTLDIQFDDGTVIIGKSNGSPRILSGESKELDALEKIPELTCISSTKNTNDTSSISNNLAKDTESEVLHAPTIIETDTSTPGSKKLTRKRSRNPEAWVMNIRKQKREAGQQYTDIKGNIHQRRNVKIGCKNKSSCKFKCSIHINDEQRKVIHESFWRLSDTKKGHFYGKYVLRKAKARVRGTTERKTFSFEYYFEVDNVKFRVCKDFFLGTLDISSQRIYYFFKHMHNLQTGLPRSPIKGNNRKKCIAEEKKEEIREHIRSFPVVESHYCRASSNKTYLETNLNLRKLYKLYLLKVEDPLKFHVYEKIFNYEFNIGFHKPKKDICDKCVVFKNISNPSEKEIEEYENHLLLKKRGKEERDRDRQNKDKKTAIVTFDMENVFSLPKSNVSSHFYKQKLNCYNLTAHCNLNKTVYCSIWHEGITGRGGCEIANALIRILIELVNDIPSVTKIILWSDSCVSQNKNSVMTFALQNFLNSTQSQLVKIIEQKFSEPGHGNLQEIDSAHSTIEAHIRNLDIHSPISLVRVLLKLPNCKLKFRILQMKSSDYYSYATKPNSLNYQLIPYTKIKNLLYSKDNLLEIKYRNSFDDDFQRVDLLKISKSSLRTAKKQKSTEPIFSVRPVKVTSILTDEKKNSLFSMLRTMDAEDQIFFKSTILKDFTPKKTKRRKSK